MKAVMLRKTGKPTVLKIEEVPDPKPTENEILVKVKYSGVNYADLLSRQGLYSWAPKRPYIPGLEIAGEIIEKGKNVNNLEIGQRVFVGTQKGGYAEKLVTHKQYALPIPQNFSWEEAAAFGVQWFTAWVALYEMARVRPGEKLLVQAAAGGVGTAAVKLGNALKLQVFGTASTEAKRNFIEKIGAIPLKYDSFDISLKDNRPNCVIETIGGDIFKRSFNILAPMGRIIAIGATSLKINKWNPISLFKAWRGIPRVQLYQVLRKSRGFLGLHIGYMLKYPDILLPSWNKMIEVIEENNLHPVILKDHIFPMSEVSKAHQFIHDRKNIGKVLLDPSK